jgi:hypothetical protein
VSLQIPSHAVDVDGNLDSASVLGLVACRFTGQYRSSGHLMDHDPVL